MGGAVKKLFDNVGKRLAVDANPASLMDPLKNIRSAKQNLGEGWNGVIRDPIAKMGSSFKPKMPDLKVPDAAPPAPTPEQAASEVVRPENIGRRKKRGRSILRIDLQTGGSSSPGVNIPVG